MNTRYSRITILLVLAAGLLLTACGQPGAEATSCDTRFPMRSHAAGNLNFGDRTEKFSFNVDQGVSEMRLELQFQRLEGTVGWSVMDPQGVVQWEGRFASGDQFREGRGFEPTHGEWRLQIDGWQASGSYDICWLGK